MTSTVIELKFCRGRNAQNEAACKYASLRHPNLGGELIVQPIDLVVELAKKSHVPLLRLGDFADSDPIGDIGGLLNPLNCAKIL